MRSTTVVLAVLAVACGNGGSMSLEPDEQDVFDRGTDTHASVQQLAGLSDSTFQFDPTLDPGKSAAENARALQSQAMTALNGCGTVTLTNATVTVDFTSTGCTLKNGSTVSGSASFSVTQTTGMVSVAETFTNLVVNGTDLSGTATFVTTNGSTFTVTASLTTKGNTLSANLTVTGTATDITFDGTTSATRAGAATAATFTAVDWGNGDCYPKSGTLKLTKSVITETMTFTAATASTGKVQVAVGRGMFTQTLPAYGSCPKG
jgi:hypothetical protein